MSTITKVKETGELVAVGLGLVVVGVGIYFIWRFFDDPLAAVDGGAQVINKPIRSATEFTQKITAGVVNTDWGQVNTLGSTQDDYDTIKKTNSTKLGNVAKLGQNLLIASPMGIGVAVSAVVGVSNKIRQGKDGAVALRNAERPNAERDRIIEHNKAELEKFHKRPRKYEPNFILVDKNPFQAKYMDKSQIDTIKSMSHHTVRKFHFIPVSSRNMDAFEKASDLYHAYKQLLLEGMFLHDDDKKACDIGTDAFFRAMQKLVHPNALILTNRKQKAAVKAFLERHDIYKLLEFK